MPERPRIEISVTPDVVPLGGDVRVSAMPRVRRGTRVNHVALAIEGRQFIRCAHCGNIVPRSRKPELTAESRFIDEGALDAGDHPLEATFSVQDTAPPSHAAQHSHFGWTARCHVDVPFWPDANAQVAFVVVPVRRARPEPVPVAIKSARTGDAPYLEAILDDRVYSPGDVIRGSRPRREHPRVGLRGARARRGDARGPRAGARHRPRAALRGRARSLPVLMSMRRTPRRV